MKKQKYSTHKEHKPARTPSARYRCEMDVAQEPIAKPVRPVTEPVMPTIRDPYRVTATLKKMPANYSSSSSSYCNRLNFINNL